MFTKAFATLKTPIKGSKPERPLNKLNIYVDYQKGGISFLCGEYSGSGVYLYLIPCTHENGVTGTFWNGDAHTMGYKIFLKECGRRSQKQIDIAASRIIPHAQEIADLYSERKHKEIYEFVKKLYNI